MERVSSVVPSGVEWLKSGLLDEDCVRMLEKSLPYKLAVERVNETPLERCSEDVTGLLSKLRGEACVPDIVLFDMMAYTLFTDDSAALVDVDEEPVPASEAENRGILSEGGASEER